MAAKYTGVLLLGVICAGCERQGDDLTLLFLGRSPVAHVGRISWAPDAARSRVVAFDGRLRVIRTVTDPRIASPVAVAPYPGDRLLVTERTGEGVVFDTTGKPLREWPGPFPASLYATDEIRIIATRSPYFVRFIGEDGSAPLLWMLDTLGEPSHGLGIIHVPLVRYFSELVNAGAVARHGDAIYFAPLVRDEILRLDATGYPVWRTSRGMFPSEADPHYVRPGDRRVAYAQVNIALAIGPDDRLYVLGSQDSSGMRLRLDVIDPDKGEIIEGRSLGTAATAVAVDRQGAIHIFDPDSLLSQTPTRGREPFAPPFDLPDLDGDTVRLDSYRGKVTLVNFWASWCDPCREEFPHMAGLYRELSRDSFAIAAISDDVNDSQMRGFVREFRPPFPILVGAGRMKATYHYRGLPYSVLLDKQGRIVERIFGFGGESEFRRLRETIARVLREPYP